MKEARVDVDRDLTGRGGCKRLGEVELLFAATRFRRQEFYATY